MEKIQYLFVFQDWSLTEHGGHMVRILGNQGPTGQRDPCLPCFETFLSCVAQVDKWVGITMKSKPMYIWIVTTDSKINSFPGWSGSSSMVPWMPLPDILLPSLWGMASLSWHLRQAALPSKCTWTKAETDQACFRQESWSSIIRGFQIGFCLSGKDHKGYHESEVE